MVSRSTLRPNPLCVLRLKLASRHLHIIVGLKIHPELGTITEVQAQAERGVRGNPSTIGNDVGDSVWRNPKCPRKLILRKAVFSQKFLLYHFARSHWRKLIRGHYYLLSVVVRDSNIVCFAIDPSEDYSPR